MADREKKQRWLFHRFIVFLLIFCIIAVLFGTAIWFFGRSFSLYPNQVDAPQSQTAVSPLLFGSNLKLDTNQVSDLSSIKNWLEQLHIRMLRLTVQHNVSLSTLQQVVSLLRDLHITPMVNLRATFDSIAKQDDLQIVNLMTSIFVHEPVYYEYGDEEDAIGITADAYTNSWNTTIEQLSQIAPDARFIGPVTYHYDSNYLNTFLVHANPQPYAISWHEFTCDTSSDKQQCLTNIAQWKKDIVNARNVMQTTLGGIFPIMITEWNYAADATPNDDKSNDDTFMTNWTEKALQMFIDNNIFAAMQYSYGPSVTSLMQNAQLTSARYKAFQVLSMEYANVALPQPITTIPQTTPTTSSDGVIVDNLNDWSNTFTHTKNVSFDSSNSQAFNNDLSRANRGSSNTHEEIVWQQSGGMTSFTAVTYFWADEPISPFSIYTSADGNIWRIAIPEIWVDHASGSWYQYLYILPDLSHVSYVKLHWNNIQGKSWSPQVGKAIITYNTSNTTVDNLNNWSNTFSHTSNLILDSTNNSAFNDDTSRAARNGVKSQEEIVWKRNKLTFFEATVYFWPNEMISPFTLYTSVDGSTWEEATPIITNSTILGPPGANWWRYIYTLKNLSHINFVKIRWNNTQGQSWSPQISKVVLVS